MTLNDAECRRRRVGVPTGTPLGTATRGPLGVSSPAPDRDTWERDSAPAEARALPGHSLPPGGQDWEGQSVEFRRPIPIGPAKIAQCIVSNTAI